MTSSTAASTPAPEPALGRRPDLRPHLDRLRVRRVHHRRLLADDRRLAASRSLRSDLALDALEQAIWARSGRGRRLDELVHHSDRGVQYLAIRYTERLAETGAVNSVGSKGDSYDNALAETMIGLYKAELVRNRGPWRGLDDLEYATLEWVDWFNHRRLFEAHGQIPPAEFEESYYRQKGSGQQAETQTKQPA